MLRRTTIWLAGLWSLLFGTAVHALSLGDIEVYSALGSPLEAEILLTSVRPGETDGMLIRLAPEEAFAQAGVERPFYLTKIKFKLAQKSDGTEYILVSTDNPVNEPFLSFLIDIDWPRGHLVREYTVLLDPPVFTGSQLARSPAESLSEPAATADAAGEPALISRDEEAAALPDIEMLDETGGAAAEADLGETSEPALTEIPASDIPPSSETPDTATGEEALAGAIPEAEIPEDMPQQESPDVTDADAASAGDWSARLEQQTLPEIGFTFDESMPYDRDRTEALLNEFGISLDSMTTVREEESGEAGQRADTYKVQEGDTLWEIANRHKAPDVTVQQAMLAILRQNPNGFIRNNINDVKKGFVLRMPGRAGMLEVSRQEAAAEVRRQYALWREYHGELAGKSSGQQDIRTADNQPSGSDASSDTAASGQLSILAPGRDAASTNRASGAQEGEEKGDATRLDLQLAREQLEAERLQKVELQSRLNDLTGQLEKMQRLLTLKDEQLAKLQERLRQLETSAKNPAAPDRQQPRAGTDEPMSQANPAATDKNEVQKPSETEKPEDAIALAKPDLAMPDLTGAAPQPDIAATDTKDSAQNATGSQTDLDKLNESIKLSDTELPITKPDLDSKPKKTRPKPRTKPVSEVAPKGGKSFLERLDAVVQPIQGFLRDQASQHLPPAYKKIADDLLASPVGLGILAGALLLMLALVITLVRSFGKAKDKAKDKVNKPKPAKANVETPPAEQQQTSKLTAKKAKPAGPSLSERLKKAFAPFATLLAKKPKPAKKPAAEEEDAVENETEEDLASAVQEAAVEVKSKAKPQKAVAEQGETVKVKAAPVKPAAQSVAAPAAAEEEISDDTTAEADVYLAYGLFDQAEELLKHALATNPGATHYRGKLLETYFAAGKKDEFEKLAAELHKSTGGRAGRIWDKAVAMGKEIAPSNPLFSGAADSGLKASDFAPAKPATADLDLGEAGGATTPDIDFGEEGATETALDLDISGAFDKTVIADDKTMIADDSTMIADDRTLIADDSTMIADDSTMIVDETSLNTPKKNDVTDSELNINFDADELGLGLELEDADNASGMPEGESEATMAMDIGLDIDNIEGITDVDSSSGSISSKSAGDDLIAELGGGDSELSLEGASDTEFDLPEDDDTLIDAGDDTFSGDSSGSEDEVSTKLDLAKAYMDMGDYDGASSTLEEVLSEGNDKQKREAEELLDQIN